MSIKKNILLRINFVFLLLCTIAAVILAQGIKIQVVEGEQWRDLGVNSTRIDTIEGERGNMYADDGRLLATSLPMFRISMDTRIVSDTIFTQEIDSLASCFALYFRDQTVEEYKQKIVEAREKDKAYLTLKREVNYNDLQIIKKWPIFKYGKYKGGFIAEQNNKRVTPFSILAKRTIGYARKNAQSVGLEGSFDHYLKGSELPVSMQRTSDGRWVPMYEQLEVDTRNGKDIYTTVDVNLQDVVHNALLGALSEHKANHGCAIVMEVKTGKIKAIANLGLGTDDTYWEKYNYAVGKKSEPGSTFKVAALTALLDDEHITPSFVVNIEGGKRKYYDKEMRDASWSPKNDLTVSQVIQQSSNVGISKLVHIYYKNNPQAFFNKMRKFQLTEKTGIEIRGEPNPTLKSPKDSDWSGITLPWMSIGYEVEVTPLQLLTFFNAIANDGKMMKPYLVSEIKELGSTVRLYRPQILSRQICKPKTAQTVRRILKGVVEKGTAKNICSTYFTMAGKTGTAKIADKKGYNSSYNASFAGFFPAEEPVYSCIVVINAPSGDSYYGSKVAAPVFKEIVEKYFSTDVRNHKPINENAKLVAAAKLPKAKNGYQKDLESIYNTLGVATAALPDIEWAEAKEKKKKVKLDEVKVMENIVPRVENMGLRDALYLLEKQGLKVRFSGKGKVVDQSPSYGTVCKKGDIVRLELK